jgi:hypothetical protein
MIENEGRIEVDVVWVTRDSVAMDVDQAVLAKSDPTVDQISTPDLGALRVQAQRDLGAAQDIIDG